MAKKYFRLSEPTTRDTEPTWTPPKAGESHKMHDLIKALNWYNTHRDEKAAAKYLKIPVPIARWFQSLAWTIRMVERGLVLPPNSNATVDSMKAKLADMLASGATGEDSDTVINIQERVANKTERIIGEMEGALVDTFGIKGDASKMNAYQWMVDNNVKPIHANRIAEYFREQALEPFKAAQGKNADLVEGYAAYSKSRLMNLLQCFANIIKDASRLSEQTKTARKPRKKKPMSFEKRVSKMNYMVRDDELKLQSMDPIRILGAQQLWIYNTKTRKLGIYNAQDSSGLDVKGSTIKNYSVNTSISKILRKPDKTLPLVVDGGKIALRRVMDGINSKETRLTGRINKDTLLLRVA